MKDRNKVRLPDHVIKEVMDQHFIVKQRIMCISPFMKRRFYESRTDYPFIDYGQLASELYIITLEEILKFDFRGFEGDKDKKLNQFHYTLKLALKREIYKWANHDKQIIQIKNKETGERVRTEGIKIIYNTDKLYPAEEKDELQKLGETGFQRIKNPLFTFFLENMEEILTDRQLQVYRTRLETKTDQEAADILGMKNRQDINNTLKAIKKRTEKKYQEYVFKGYKPKKELTEIIRTSLLKIKELKLSTDKEKLALYIVEQIRNLIDNPLIEDFPDLLNLNQKKTLNGFIQYNEEIENIGFSRGQTKIIYSNYEQLPFNELEVIENQGIILEIGLIFESYLIELNEQLQRNQKTIEKDKQQDHFFIPKKVDKARIN